MGLQSVSRQKTSVKKKIGLIMFGLFLSMVLFEIGLRIGGIIILSLQEYRNRVSIRQKGTYRILCLGESTTYCAWSHPLEEILNRLDTGIKFSVIDKGIPGITTTGILARLEDYLDRYNPDMVITMMGINDGKDSVTYENTFSKKIILFLKKLKISKLANFIWLRTGNKVSSIVSRNPVAKSGESIEKNLKNINEGGGIDPEIWISFKEDKVKIEQMFRESIEINPNNDRLLYIQLGVFYSIQGEYDKAEEMVKKAIEINPEDSSQAYTALGLIYKYQGEYDKAKEMFKTAIKRNPGSDIPYLELGRHYMNRGEYDKAAGLLNKAIKIIPGNNKIYVSLALCYEEQGKYVLAKECYEKATKIELENYNPVTRRNYQKLDGIVTRRGIKLVCVQYPMRSIEPLKKLFQDPAGIIFVDNEKVYKEALKKAPYEKYFTDIFGGDFGHCTDKGNRLLAQNIADVILKEYFDKRRR